MGNGSNNRGFLPTSKKEAESLGWDYIDVILFTGDAYVDHPSFGAAVIARVLESAGYRVAVVPQPNWQDDLRDFRKLGEPRLFFGVTSGNMDSMVNHYTANKRLRSDDAYTPGDKAGARPDYAVTVYSQILKKLYPTTNLVIGGIEASMRRFAHYDYWSNKLLPSVLIGSGADFLIYGMAEQSIVQLARHIENKTDYTAVPQLVYRSKSITAGHENMLTINSYEECLNDKKKYAANFALVETESNRMQGAAIAQRHGDGFIVANPMQQPPGTEALDAIYKLPFTRRPHPRYDNKPAIPAYAMIRDSVNIHRGCFGGCSFCTISAHQGKFISSRSEASVLAEVDALAALPDFSGHINDLGGPSANMYRMQGRDNAICAQCRRPSCIFPAVCRNLDTSHQALNTLYDAVARHPKVKKLSIGSGVRYDIALHPTGEAKTDTANREYLNRLIRKHVSGRLKVAPEHTSDKVLKLMRKPSYQCFTELKTLFDSINRQETKKLQLIPYFISSHPGCGIADMALLAITTKEQGYRLEQVQDFTPTPMTLSTVMYYTGINPYSGEKVFTPRSVDDKKAQQKYFFWYKPENRNAIVNELNSFKLQHLAKRLYGSENKPSELRQRKTRRTDN